METPVETPEKTVASDVPAAQSQGSDSELDR